MGIDTGAELNLIDESYFTELERHIQNKKTTNIPHLEDRCGNKCNELLGFPFLSLQSVLISYKRGEIIVFK